MRSIPLKSSYCCVTTCIPFPSKSKWKLFRAQCSNSEEYSHNGLFSRSLKRWKIFRLRAPRLGVFGEFIFKSEIARANERYLDRFSTSGDNDGSVESRAWGAKGRKKVTILFNIMSIVRSYANRLRAEMLSVRAATLERRDTRSENVCLGTYEHLRITLMAFLIAVGEFRSWCNLNFPVPAPDISVIFHLCVIVWKVRRVMQRFRSHWFRLITVFCPAQIGPSACDLPPFLPPSLC